MRRLATTLALVVSALAGAATTARCGDDAPAAPPATAPDAATEYKALTDAYRKAQNDWSAEQRRAFDAATKAAEEAKARGETPKPVPAYSMTGGPAADFVPKFRDFAARHADAAQALEALLFVAMNGAQGGDPESAKAAIATILDHYVDDVKIQRLLVGLPRMQTVVADPTAALAGVAERSKNPEVRAVALIAPVWGKLGMDSEATAEEQTAARVVFERVAKEFPATAWGRRAAGTLHEAFDLAVGKPAPEFEGKDADGRAIKLSDFRGKAVLIDFWGFW